MCLVFVIGEADWDKDDTLFFMPAVSSYVGLEAILSHRG
jgi:hypothetical protein